MGQIQPPRFENLKTIEDLARFLGKFVFELGNIINGGIDIDPKNLNMQFLAVKFVAANTEQKVPHTLNRIPTGYLVVRASAACSIYDGVSANSSTGIYLKSDALATVTLILF